MRDERVILGELGFNQPGPAHGEIRRVNPGCGRSRSPVEIDQRIQAADGGGVIEGFDLLCKILPLESRAIPNA